MTRQAGRRRGRRTLLTWDGTGEVETTEGERPHSHAARASPRRIRTGSEGSSSPRRPTHHVSVPSGFHSQAEAARPAPRPALACSTSALCSFAICGGASTVPRPPPPPPEMRQGQAKCGRRPWPLEETTTSTTRPLCLRCQLFLPSTNDEGNQATDWPEIQSTLFEVITNFKFYDRVLIVSTLECSRGAYA